MDVKGLSFKTKMNLIFLGFATNFAFIQLLTKGVGSSLTFDSECMEWKNVSRGIEKVSLWKNVSCSANQLCTGFECNGELEVPVRETIQFGMTLLPCTYPLKLEVNVNVGGYPYNLTLNVAKDPIKETIPLPGAPEKLGLPSVEANLTLYVSSGGLQLVTTEVNLTIKSTSPQFERVLVLIPRTTVPYPACLSPPPVALSTTSYSNASQMTGETCSYLSMEKTCSGDNQMCIDNGDVGACMCITGFLWHENLKQCLNPTPTVSPSSDKPDFGIIIGATVSGVVLVAGIFIMIFYKYRRNRERYGQHTLLVNSENDTELDDPDAPMLNG